MKKLSSKGFSAIEALLILVIIGMIGGLGFYVYNFQKKTNQSVDNTKLSKGNPEKTEKKEEPKQETSPISLYGGKVTLNVPKSWKTSDKKEPCEMGAGSPPDAICLSALQTAPPDFPNPNGGERSLVVANLIKTNVTLQQVIDDIGGYTGSPAAKFEVTNGHEALFVRSTAGDTTDLFYAVRKGDLVLTFTTFEKSSYRDSSNKIVHEDFTQYTSTIEDIVKSIVFN